MSEDKGEKVDLVIPRGTEVDVSHISPEKMNELHEKKHLVFEIDADRSSVQGGTRANINEVVVKDMPAPKGKGA